ncbi:MAG: DUF4136 domain-containing protein [Pseudomonadota bacterium]
MARRGITFCAVLWLLTACAVDSVKTQYEADAPLRVYKTFDWMASEKRGVSVDDMAAFRLDAAIRDSVHRELTARAYKYQTLGSPDFFVSYRVSAIDPAGAGTLEVEIHDGRTRRLVWRAWLMEAVPAKLDEPDVSMNAHVGTAIRQILHHFPPR